MSVIETIALISQTISKMLNFVLNTDECKQALDEYMEKMYKEEKWDSADENNYAIVSEFVVNAHMGEEHKKFAQYFIEKNPELTEDEKAVAASVGNAVESVFEVKKILRSGFELYNIINEKEYSAIPLVKMSHLRGIFAGHYIIATLINYQGESYLIELKESYTAAEKREVYDIAVAYMIGHPESVYADNPKKEKAISDLVKQLKEKFLKCFGTKEIIATNNSVEELIKVYDGYCTGKLSEEDCAEAVKNAQQPKEYKYFKVEELENASDGFLERSLAGFSSHSEEYDVGFVFDDELGSYVIPFYGTLKKIFEVKEYEKIEGYKECVKRILENSSVPHKIIYTLSKQYPDFMKRVNAILGTKYTLEELIAKYKWEYLEKKIYSPSAVLFDSGIFLSALDSVISEDEDQEPVPDVAEPEPKEQTVGRNDPCPCGSGLKYKKCCMNKR